MTRSAQLSIALEQKIIRFPDLFFQGAEARLISPNSFEKDAFFRALFSAHFFNDRFFAGVHLGGSGRHKWPGEQVHGPFRIDALEPDDWIEVPFVDTIAEIRSQVTLSGIRPPQWRHLDPQSSLQLLDAYFDRIGADVSRCYRLRFSLPEAVSGELAAYYSEFYRQTGVGLYFKSWVTHRASDAAVHQFILGYD